MIHARRCGWVSAQTMGMVQLDLARQNGVEYCQGRILQMNVSTDSRRCVESVVVDRDGELEHV